MLQSPRHPDHVKVPAEDKNPTPNTPCMELISDMPTWKPDQYISLVFGDEERVKPGQKDGQRRASMKYTE